MTAVAITIRGMAISCFIPLNDRRGNPRAFAVVDFHDWLRLRQFKWYLARDGYAYRNIGHAEGGGHTSMHRQILGVVGRRQEVDHINRDKLDNRRPNLRKCESWQNKQNIPAKGRSKYRGVSFHRQSQKWRARCQIQGKVHSLGYFASEEEAGRAGDEFRRRHMAFNRTPSP